MLGYEQLFELLAQSGCVGWGSPTTSQVTSQRGDDPEFSIGILGHFDLIILVLGFVAWLCHGTRQPTLLGHRRLGAERGRRHEYGDDKQSSRASVADTVGRTFWGDQHDSRVHRHGFAAFE